MKLLAIETSTEACSVGLMIDGHIETRHRLAPQQHGVLVLPMIDELMSDAGIAPAQLDAVAYGRGPGSFTGVRIGVALTQGIALGADLGVIGISTLHSMAQSVHRTHDDNHIAVSLDARMDEVYFAAFTADEAGIVLSVVEECICPPESVPLLERTQPWVWCGSGAERYADKIPDVNESQGAIVRMDVWPHAHDMLVLAAPLYAANKITSPEQAMPVYLRDKVAETTAERLVSKQLRDANR